MELIPFCVDQHHTHTKTIRQIQKIQMKSKKNKIKKYIYTNYVTTHMIIPAATGGMLKH